jgi:dihydrofolate synthase/folylpolyglutamate synthase
MTYKETLNYLYSCTPAFHQVGKDAYKPGLERSMMLDKLARNPHRNYRTIHVAGTNGKGSVTHLLAAILMSAKYKVGLYTSPHLTDFCERIRVNGKKIYRQYVVDFVARHQAAIESLHPSFFELTSSMAFDFFRHKKVDFAIIEAGLGGRLDSTNIIRPILSVITNISADHTQYLGDTLPQIASEKAGIIKPLVPVVIGEAGSRDVRQVFMDKARATLSAIHFAEDAQMLTQSRLEDGRWHFHSSDYGALTCELGGLVQRQNTQTVLMVLRVLRDMNIRIPAKAIRAAFEKVTELTGLMGRWQTLYANPFVICDTGHNAGAWENLTFQLQQEAQRHSALRMVVGMVQDKAIDDVLALMPPKATYYFTQASVSRALPAQQFAEKARRYGLSGNAYETVTRALDAALKDAQANDMIFVGGSTFIVADALPLFPNAYK